MPSAQRQVTNGLLDRLLARHALQAVLVAPEDIIDSHVDAAPLQVNAGEASRLSKPISRSIGRQTSS